MISTSNFLNIQADLKTGQNINSIKLDFSKISFQTPTNDLFTGCKHCGALLIDQDKKIVTNQNQQGEFEWLCRFCKKQNITKEMHFVQNNYKFAIEKQLKTKITPPIILFVIDNSGSMYQSIFHNLKYGNNPQIISQAKKGLHSSFIQILTESKLYKMQRQMMEKLSSKYTNIVKGAKYSQEQISKIVFLYAMIEHNIKNLVKKQKKLDFRVGFIFFSDMIYILKGAKQKQIPVYVQNGELCHQQWPYKKYPIDFFQYQQLYNAGRSYEKYFGDSRLKNFDIQKLAINKVKGGGRTALGPALALAMGIISMHDQGSRIIVVTDSLPNFGVLSVGDSEQVYKKIGNCLQQNGATLSILKWTGDELVKNKQEEIFINFRNAYRDYVQQTQLNLVKCKQSKLLDISIMSLNSLINKEAIGHSCQVTIQCDNPKIIPQKLPIDFNNYKNIRFLSNRSRCWLSLNINKKALKQYDYLFPVITQTVVKYADMFTKQRYIFMSYTKHQLIRPNLMKNMEEQQSMSYIQLAQESINIQNLNELCSLELVHIFQNRRIAQDFDNDRDQIKTVFRYKQIQLEKDIRDVNDIAMLKNNIYEEGRPTTLEDENYQKL